MTDTFTPAELRANCEACTLGAAMRDCQKCAFDYGDAPHATAEDFAWMRVKLWGGWSLADVGSLYRMAGEELLDLTQIQDPPQECQCTDGTVYKWREYPATVEMPPEIVGRLTCDECGEDYELGYQPTHMELKFL